MKIILFLYNLPNSGLKSAYFEKEKENGLPQFSLLCSNNAVPVIAHDDF